MGDNAKPNAAERIIFRKARLFMNGLVKIDELFDVIRAFCCFVLKISNNLLIF